ncbi:MAG: D-Ala-D-Ala carboxypeptidase family metallohydrolase [Chromatiales bacterium]|nr:D-Ala-D-Ala carboxypeptidase family metallohydrolase [Chromatiales bacterium]
MKRIQLSKNFYLDEFQRSQTATRHGIDMTIVEGGVFHANLKRLCRDVLQPVRNHFGPVSITSGYRPAKLNKLIKGSKTSQHLTCQAADFVVPGHTPLEVARWIRDNCKGYDQLIHEFGEWVHVSVPQHNQLPRQMNLTAAKLSGLFGRLKTVYVTGLISVETAIKGAA